MPLCPEGDALPARLSLQLWPARSPSPRSGTYASGPWAFALGSTGLRTLRAGVASVATTLANALAATSARCPPTALLEWARRISGSPPALGLVPSVRLAAPRRYASVQGHRVSGSLGCRPRSGAPPDPRRAPDHSASGNGSPPSDAFANLKTVLSRSDEVSLGPVRWFLSLKPFCVETLCSRGCRASQDLGQLEVLTSCRWHILACGFAPGVSHPATQSASRPPGCGCILDAAFATPRPPPLRLEHSTVLMSLDVTTSLPHGRVASRDHISVWR